MIILEKEKMRHLEQNALDKENLEILLENAKKENEKISMRLKEQLEYFVYNLSNTFLFCSVISSDTRI